MKLPYVAILVAAFFLVSFLDADEYANQEKLAAEYAQMLAKEAACKTLSCLGDLE